MAVEVFKNDPTVTGGSWSTLASGYTSGATSLTITSNTPYGSADPTASPPTKFRVRIDNEIFVVTDNRTTTWTVAGAQGGSSAANHSSGATVTEVVTATSYQELQIIPGFRYAAGQYYQSPGYDTSSHTLALTQSAPLLTPFPVSVAATATSLVVRCTTTAASSTVRLGIYRDNGSGQPGNLVLDAGTVDTAASTGNKTITISQLLKPDLYWLCIVAQGGAPTMQTMALAASVIGPYNGANPNFSAACSWTAANVTGALPSTLSSLTNGGSTQVTKVLVGF